MRLLLVIMALTGLLTSCSKDSVDSQTPPVSEVSAITPATVENVITETERLNLWFEERFEEQLTQSPIRMTVLGRKDKYDQIDDYSEAAEERRLQWRATTVDELTTNFEYGDLSDDAKISYDIWVFQYESDRAMAPFRRNWYFFSQMDGAQSALPGFLINYHRVDDVSDMRAYITRIAGISRVVDQLLDRTKVAAGEGVRPPRFAYEGVLSEARNLLNGVPFSSDGAQDAPMWADAQAKIEALHDTGKVDDARAEELTEAAKAALLESFQPAYSRLIAWFEADIDNSAEDAKGVGALPNGEAYYNAALMLSTTLPVTAVELHQTGLEEVARLRAEMETTKAYVGFKGSLEDFFDFIKTDKQFYYSNDEEGRQRYIDETTRHLNYINDKLPEYFGILPKADLIVKRVEAYREQDGGAAYYNSGTPDGSRPGVYYLHLSDMNANLITELEATAYHEGNPGHHMETAISQELTGVPMFRTQAFFNSYSEGWALYSETLAKEMGAYQNPYSDFGRLTLEIWRAIRLVVDTGIHAMGWTEQQAIAYFTSNSPLAETTIKSEIHRYFVWPGQATSYKVGMLKIQALRKKAERELGDKYDIREFHDIILGGGPLPLTIMERVVDDWLEKTKASKS
jgi:uncharacterized protein (DUF885 family)